VTAYGWVPLWAALSKSHLKAAPYEIARIPSVATVGAAIRNTRVRNEFPQFVTAWSGMDVFRSRTADAAPNVL
jgi:hypothetical protein